jgi:hypothetical protein
VRGATPTVRRTGGRFIATGERIVDKSTTGTHRRSRERMSMTLKSPKPDGVGWRSYSMVVDQRLNLGSEPVI